MVRRLSGFHRDDRGQIMPLMFAAGIIFFTGIILVLNTGKTVNRRVQAQNAVDAAAVSGATVVARGMNYLATNNVTKAKILTSVVILRAFRPSIRHAWSTLHAYSYWRQSMWIVGQILAKIPVPPLPAIGKAMVVASDILGLKIWQERFLLAGYESGKVGAPSPQGKGDQGFPPPTVEPLFGFKWLFTPGGSTIQPSKLPTFTLTAPVGDLKNEEAGKKQGKRPSLLFLTDTIRGYSKGGSRKGVGWDRFDLKTENPPGGDPPKGIAWSMLKFLHGMGKVIAIETPFLAQYHAGRVYKRNLIGPGTFGDFLDFKRRVQQLGQGMGSLVGGNPGAFFDSFVAAASPGALMLPVVPLAPVCEGLFRDTYYPVRTYVNMAKKPLETMGFVLLTFSLWPVYYGRDVRHELKALYAGPQARPPDPTDIPGLSESDRREIERLQREIEALQIQIAEKRERIRVIDEVELPAERAKKEPDQDRIEDLLLEKGWNKGNPPTAEARTAFQKSVGPLVPAEYGLWKEIRQLTDEVDRKRKELERYRPKPPPPGPGGSGEIGAPPPDPPRPEDPPYRTIHPWLTISGLRFPGKDVGAPSKLAARYTYLTLGWRTLPEIVESSNPREWWRLQHEPLYEHPLSEIPGLRNLGFAYAQAKVYCKTRGRFTAKYPQSGGTAQSYADLWSPDWRAKLVRVQFAQVRLWQGATPKTCAQERLPTGAVSKVDKYAGKVSRH